MPSQPMVNNQLLGCLSWSEEAARDSIQIAGVRLLARSKSSVDDRWQLQFIGTPNTILLSGSAPHHNATAYLWGSVVHPGIETSEIPAWAAQAGHLDYPTLSKLGATHIFTEGRPTFSLDDCVQLKKIDGLDKDAFGNPFRNLPSLYEIKYCK